MAAGKKYALDTILSGRAGEIHRGEEVPATFVDMNDDEHPTDFARLEDLGLVSDKKPDVE
jgi:hypothetical protein